MQEAGAKQIERLSFRELFYYIFCQSKHYETSYQIQLFDHSVRITREIAHFMHSLRFMLIINEKEDKVFNETSDLIAKSILGKYKKVTTTLSAGLYSNADKSITNLTKEIEELAARMKEKQYGELTKLVFRNLRGAASLYNFLASNKEWLITSMAHDEKEIKNKFRRLLSIASDKMIEELKDWTDFLECLNKIRIMFRAICSLLTEFCQGCTGNKK